MIVYDGLKRDFLQSVDNDTIALEIEENILQKMGRHTVKNEFISWDNSMQYMYKVMNDPEIPEDAGIAIEYNIPQTSKRVDFMISGYDIDGRPGMVIIELKQWSELNRVEKSEALVETYTGHALRKVVHPIRSGRTHSLFPTIIPRCRIRRSTWFPARTCTIIYARTMIRSTMSSTVNTPRQHLHLPKGR